MDNNKKKPVDEQEVPHAEQREIPARIPAEGHHSEAPTTLANDSSGNKVDMSYQVFEVPADGIYSQEPRNVLAWTGCEDFLSDDFGLDNANVQPGCNLEMQISNSLNQQSLATLLTQSNNPYDDLFVFLHKILHDMISVDKIGRLVAVIMQKKEEIVNITKYDSTIKNILKKVLKEDSDEKK